MSNSIKICLEKVTHRFILPGNRELTALQDTNLCIEKGEIVVLIGQSGCGKTTLLNLMAGLLPPSSGKITIDGKIIDRPDSSRMMMFQQPCVLPWLTVEQNIAFGCKLRGEEKGLAEKVEDYIHLIGLKGFEKVYPAGLSGGMMQRVALARSLIGEPDVLLMDEAFSDVDFLTRATLYELLLQLWVDLGFTMVLVTHDIEEAMVLGQRIVLMGNRPGRIVKVFENPLPYPRSVLDKGMAEIKHDILGHFDG